MKTSKEYASAASDMNPPYSTTDKKKQKKNTPSTPVSASRSTTYLLRGLSLSPTWSPCQPECAASNIAVRTSYHFHPIINPNRSFFFFKYMHQLQDSWDVNDLHLMNLEAEKNESLLCYFHYISSPQSWPLSVLRIGGSPVPFMFHISSFVLHYDSWMLFTFSASITGSWYALRWIPTNETLATDASLTICQRKRFFPYDGPKEMFLPTRWAKGNISSRMIFQRKRVFPYDLPKETLLPIRFAKGNASSHTMCQWKS